MSSVCDFKNSNDLIKKSNQIFAKANKIHLELLTFVQNELNEKKKIIKNFYSYSVREKAEIQEEKNIDNKKNLEKKSNKADFNSDEEDDEGEESSSDMSCSEECIIDL